MGGLLTAFRAIEAKSVTGWRGLLVEPVRAAPLDPRRSDLTTKAPRHQEIRKSLRLGLRRAQSSSDFVVKRSAERGEKIVGLASGTLRTLRPPVQKPCMGSRGTETLSPLPGLEFRVDAAGRVAGFTQIPSENARHALPASGLCHPTRKDVLYFILNFVISK